MPEFNFAFTVNAPLQQVSQFHGDTSALKKLTPPPMIVQVHRVEPLGKGRAPSLRCGPVHCHSLGSGASRGECKRVH